MKKILLAILLYTALMSCNNNALDGDAKTDSTKMPADTNVSSGQTDHVNRDDATNLQLDSTNKGAMHQDSIRQSQRGEK